MEVLTLEIIQQRLEPLAKKVIEQAGMELIELKVAGHKNDVLIQITADKPSGGINIRECAILNKSVVAAIEQESLLPPEIFSLELCSPGLDRPLLTRRDFMRLKGKNLHFWLTEAVQGKKETEGILKEVGEDTVTINTPKKNEQVLPLSIITKGILVI